MIECVHDWELGEVEIAAYRPLVFHPCVHCRKCETLVDLVYEDDPREI